jgi:anti-sigma B factor antagonist
LNARRKVESVRIAVRFNDDVAVVTLSGKFLAGSDGPFLRQKIKDLVTAGTRKLLVDFAGVPYIDSTGLGFLAGSRATAESTGTRLVLANLNEHVQKVLDDVQLSQFFDIAANESAALERLRKAPAEPGKSARPKTRKTTKSENPAEQT